MLFSESQLPPSSVAPSRQATFWQHYGRYIVEALIIIALQTLLIVILLVHRARRRRAETELRDSQEFMDMAMQAAELGLWVRDSERDDLWGNAALRSIFGFRQNESLHSNDLLMRVHPDDSARVVSAVQRAQDGNLPFEGEFRILLPEGKERWVLARGRVVDSSRGRGVPRMGVVMDITDRKRAEEALEQERAYLRQIIDIDPNFIFAKDREGRFTLVNQAVADAYGTTVENLIGKTDADFNPNREEIEYFRKMDLEVMDRLEERFIPEERITDAQGKVRWLQTVKRPIVGKDGLANQVLGASTDITRRKEMDSELQHRREELAHVTRITALGELAASLAHELNQPLTAILSNAQAAQRFLAAKPADLEEIKDILKDIVEDNSRASEIIRRMRALVKKENLAFVSLELGGVIRDILQLVHSDAMLRNVRISFEGNSKLPFVRGDKVQLQQVLLNLLLNAFDAMKDAPANEREVVMRVDANGTGVVEVSVRDRGVGLTTDKLDKIFQPFFTTKRDGLGMGLAISRSIIEAHGGRLWAENNQDRGATFHMVLPAFFGAEEKPENPA